MLFNTIDFAIFLPLVFAIYWLIPARNIRQQNTVLLIASYVFYGWWDYRFLSLIAFSTLVDFFVAQRIETSSSKKNRKGWLLVSLLTNLGLLAYFKYFNFFVDNFYEVFRLLGNDMQSPVMDIVLPVGISFYTFQTLSYTIDVYRGKIKPSNNLIDFAGYVSFFPQLVAGPIERASELLPQFNQARRFDAQLASEGLKQILWGLVKKVVIADQCALAVNAVYGAHMEHNGATLVIASALFAFQIYGDFSGYSDIAIGTAKLFGFRLMQNFNYPYFSRDMAEFWRRWHISLSTWFRDYVYIPLGGSRNGKGQAVRNTLIIFLVSGLWHGANWTFILWGLLNAIYFLPLLLRGKNRTHLGEVADDRLLPTLKELLQILSTFALTTLAWVFFRSESAGQAFEIFNTIFSLNWGATSSELSPHNLFYLSLLSFIGFEWIGRRHKSALYVADRLPTALRYIIYNALIVAVWWFSGEELTFIYFQF